MSKRKSFRFGTRTAFILLTIVLLGLYGWSIYYQLYNGPNQLVQLSFQPGWSVKYDWEDETRATFLQKKFPHKIDKRIVSLTTGFSVDTQQNFQISKNLINYSVLSKKSDKNTLDFCKLLKNCGKLRHLKIKEPIGKEATSYISKLSQLESLDISLDKSVKNLRFLKPLTNLRSLKILGHFESLIEFDSYKKLRVLCLSNSKEFHVVLEDVPESLQSLSLNRASIKNTERTPSSFRKLRQLVLTNCELANEIELFKKWPNLEVLCLYRTPLEDSTALSSLTKLETLDLQGTRIANLDGVRDLDRLKHLDIRTPTLLNIGKIDRLKNLEELKLFPDLILDLNSVKDLPSLIWFDCPNPEMKEFLKSIQNRKTDKQPYDWHSLKIPFLWKLDSIH